ncbi:MAG: hypothetical protein E7311_03585 [Clostridiales bacterium]|nr:hypothetical protein [Clostridiales bacterium]
MAKVKISKVEPNEKELKAEKLVEKDLDVVAIEKGTKVKAKATKAKTTTRRTTTKKTKDEEIEK